MKKPFWKNAVVYQIYPRSFCDSNGDGIGDIPGIISKLDYLKDLGVDILWLSPIYESPQFDIGYDISDYYKINPEYGTMEDFDRLIAETKKRGMRIVMDLVANHTSDRHPWFQASKDKNSPYHDYYVWMDGKDGGKRPPNNWTSNFTGPAWTYVPETGQWYLHIFAAEQPDLNWKNPKVVEEVENIIRFYLDKGVYGFRCDVINQIWKDSYEDSKRLTPLARGNEFYLMKEGNHRMLRKIYDDVLSHYEDCVMIGETYNVDLENGKRFQENKELTMFFQFELANVRAFALPVFERPFSAKRFKEVAFKWQKGIEWPTNYLENHDQRRSINKFGDPKRYWKESGKALALFNLTLRGTPFIYQGEEIGMLDLPPRDPAKSMDCSARMTDQLMKKMGVVKGLRKKMINRFDRDHSRSPMQWNDGVSAGFSSNENPWICANSNKDCINVITETKDSDSILSFYRSLLAYRRKSPALQEGTFLEIETKGDLIAYRRKLGDEEILVLLNLTKKRLRLPAFLRSIEGRVALATREPGEDPSILLPYEGRLIELA